MTSVLDQIGRPAKAAKKENKILRLWSVSVALLIIAALPLALVGLDDYSAISAVLGVVGLVAMPFIHYPVPTMGLGALLAVTKPHLVTGAIGSIVVASVYLWSVPVQNNISLTVAILALFFVLATLSFVPQKNLYIKALMLGAIAFIISGTLKLVQYDEAQLLNVWQRHPDITFSIAVSAGAALWLYFVLRRGTKTERVSGKDMRRYEEESRAWELRHRKYVANMRRMSKLEDEDPDKYLEEYVKGEDLDLHPGPEPKRPGNEDDPINFFAIIKAAAIIWFALLAIGAKLLFS